MSLMKEIKQLKDELHDNKISKEQFCDEFDRLIRYSGEEIKESKERIENLEKVLSQIMELTEDIL